MDSVCWAPVSRAVCALGATNDSGPLTCAPLSGQENGSSPGPVLCAVGLQCPTWACLWWDAHRTRTCSRTCKQGNRGAMSWAHNPAHRTQPPWAGSQPCKKRNAKREGLLQALHFKSLPQNPTHCGSVQIPSKYGPMSTMSNSPHCISAPSPASMIQKQVGGFSSCTGALHLCPGLGVTLLQVCCDLFSPKQALCKLSLAVPGCASWVLEQCTLVPGYLVYCFLSVRNDCHVVLAVISIGTFWSILGGSLQGVQALALPWGFSPLPWYLARPLCYNPVCALYLNKAF